MRSHQGTRPGRRAVVPGTVLTLALAVGGLTGCGNEAPEPSTDPGAAEELEELRDDITALRERVRALEERSRPSSEPTPPPSDDGGADSGDGATSGAEAPPRPVEDPAGVFQDPAALIGRDVTVVAEVSDVVAVSEVGAAFRLADGAGNTVGVITATPPGDLEVGDVQRVTGTVGRVSRDRFEAVFGIAADVLVDDPEAFFTDLGGEIAIAARDVEAVPQPAG
ncbi:hypothetical protein ACI8AG_20280 [Blastococcus sp. SYSU DS0552]